ncbi:MAG: OsmC family protein [Anaerolineales bacterium]
MQHIQEALKHVVQHYTDNPDKAISEDKAATAIVEDGLRCKATGPYGWELVSDMAKGIGGGASAPSPGWLMRAALADCDATMIALRAAELGIQLETLEVIVGSTSDDRGLLQMDDSIPAGPIKVWTQVRIGAKGVAKEKLREIVDWAEKHSPVGDAINRAIPLEVKVEVT